MISYCQVTPSIGRQGRGEEGDIRLMEDVVKLSWWFAERISYGWSKKYP